MLLCLVILMFLRSCVGFEDVPNQFRLLLYHRVILTDWGSIFFLEGFVPLFSGKLFLEAETTSRFLSDWLLSVTFRATLGCSRPIIWFCPRGMTASALAEESDSGRITRVDYHVILFLYSIGSILKM